MSALQYGGAGSNLRGVTLYVLTLCPQTDRPTAVQLSSSSLTGDADGALSPRACVPGLPGSDLALFSGNHVRFLVVLPSRSKRCRGTTLK
jgi:hypothetical protein